MTTGPTRAIEELRAELDAAERRAWDSLARYKFWMFGYHCGIWVHLNRIGHFRRPNPWRTLVEAARTRQPWPPKPEGAPLLDRPAAPDGGPVADAEPDADDTEIEIPAFLRRLAGVG